MIIFRIKELRDKKKVTLYNLSKLTGIARSYLCELENGKKINPTLETLYKISTILNVNIKDLFYTTLDIEELKKKLNKRIDKFGLNSSEALEISQLIDLLINIDIEGSFSPFSI